MNGKAWASREGMCARASVKVRHLSYVRVLSMYMLSWSNWKMSAEHLNVPV